MLNGETAAALVTKWLKGLACKRPLFHSEADFQHALAWHIQNSMPDWQVRLESKPFCDKNLYLDIWLPNAGVAVELKYKTKKFEMSYGGEFFWLREQYAQDCGRYDFLLDVSRLEKLVDDSSVQANVGLAIFLTNDFLYWRDPESVSNSSPGRTIDRNFRIHEGQTRSGKLKWCKPYDDWKPPNREAPIILRGAYDTKWRDYYSFGTGGADLFRYLFVKVAPSPDLEGVNRSKHP